MQDTKIHFLIRLSIQGTSTKSLIRKIKPPEHYPGGSFKNFLVNVNYFNDSIHCAIFVRSAFGTCAIGGIIVA